MTKRRWLLLAVLLIVAFQALPWARKALREQGRSFSRELDLGPDRIAVLPVYGEIMDSGWTVRWLKRFAYDVRGVKAIVLALDTPGGGVAPSQEICQAIERLRDDGIVVVASMGSLAASGGYYIASACDEIVANPGTITGSIGVVMETVHIERLLEKVGARFETIKSGEFKDAGNFSRPLAPRERALFQTAINDVQGQFLDAVIRGREAALAEALARRDGGKADDYSDAELRSYAGKLADGRIYTGRQAQALGLVDQLGGMDDAIDRAAELAGLEDPEVITYREPRSIAEWVTGMDRAQWRSLFREALQAGGPRFSFLLR